MPILCDIEGNRLMQVNPTQHLLLRERSSRTEMSAA